jgi:hypothetical protein
MIITEKVFDKVQHPFLTKITEQTRCRKELNQPAERHLQKCTASIINGDKMNASL